MEFNLLEWIGYVASVLIALSMMVNSIVKFRWINLCGAVLFSTYGFMIHAIPVGILNGIIVGVDAWYLWLLYTKKEQFEVLEIQSGSDYLKRFIQFHSKDIQKICPGFAFNPELNTVSFYILRNMQVAGLFLAHRQDQDVLRVGLDFVIPEYRDYKNGRFVYEQLSKRFVAAGYKTVKAAVSNPINDSYFKKLGFKKDEEGVFSKAL